MRVSVAYDTLLGFAGQAWHLITSPAVGAGTACEQQIADDTASVRSALRR